MDAARVGELWAALTGAPAGFGPVPRATVSPNSQLCPSGWVGIVLIADAVVATAPTLSTARAVRATVTGQPRSRTCRC
jgi:hypothetical protein